MAAKIQDGGRKFWILWTKKLDMVLKNSHTKNGACCRSVTGQSLTASTIKRSHLVASTHFVIIILKVDTEFEVILEPILGVMPLLSFVTKFHNMLKVMYDNVISALPILS